jgi:aryl-alcohol dehydrogenase-like predicted oxidoreductase
LSFNNKIVTTTTTNTYASGLKVTITEDSKEDEKSKLMSRHEMGTMITSLTNKVNALEETIQRVRDVIDSYQVHGDHEDIPQAEILTALDGK